MRSLQPDFEIIEHTADVGLRVRAPSRSELFARAALGLTALLVELMGSDGEQEREIRLTSPDVESLLYDWLSEFIFLFDAEQLVLVRFEHISVAPCAQTPGWEVAATAVVRKFNSHSDAVKTYVKAITYHCLAVTEDSAGYTAQVVVDI